jgi:penicillin-binding protein 1C
LYVTLSDLVAAYGTLANDGRELKLRFFREEHQATPREPPSRDPSSRDPPPRQVFSPYAAREIGLFLSDDTARLPSFPRMSVLEFSFPVAIKTGTSQGFRDAWTVAYSSRYIVGIWMGNPDNHPMNRVAGIVSAVYAARIMRHLHPRQEEGIDASPFPVPDATESVKVCAISGEAAGPDCPSTIVERFLPSEAPRALCSVHRRTAVDSRDGSPATASTPPRRVVLRPTTVLPAIYAVWGSRHGFGEASIEAPSARESMIAITYPATGARFLLDPDTPMKFQTLPLEASVQPRARWIDWYADGALVARAAFPYNARFPLRPGTHLLQAVVPDTGEKSGVVAINVR